MCSAGKTTNNKRSMTNHTPKRAKDARKSLISSFHGILSAGDDESTATASSSLGIFSVRLKRGPMPAEERKRLGCHCCKQARGYCRNGIMPVCWSSSYFCANLEG